MGYTKLFSEIVASTIWREDDKTRIVWITMLAMKDERHMVEASVPGLADMARVSIKECEMALKKLSGPDIYSRNQSHQGRRIEKQAGGWLILNGEYYRQKMSQEDRREYQRKKQAEYRAIKGTPNKAKKSVVGDPVSGTFKERERRFEKADGDGDIDRSDEISGEGLP